MAMEWRIFMGFGAVVSETQRGSIADELGIEPGDCILKINDVDITDYLDYKFLSSYDEIVLTVLKKNGEIIEFEIYNEFGEDLGINFPNMLFDRPKSCVNKCIFCFIDQLPGGMRRTLYFKDDDSRLSFFYGNYVTLTNMDDSDIDRLIRYRISPVNISVHTVNPELRVKMLGNKNAGRIMDQIMCFYKSNITMNMQIVLCKGINDGHELNATVQALAALYPVVASISVVPVGITKYREKLFKLSEFKEDDCVSVIESINEYQKKNLEKYGSRIVYLSDEFYITGNKDIPKAEEYEDFPQIENGVGMIASMQDEFESALREDMVQEFYGKNVIATGVLSYNFIKGLVEKVKKRYNKINASVVCIENDFFGHTVTVSGLICGVDLIKNLKGKSFDRLLITKSMLKADEDVFLDGVTLCDLEKELGASVVAVENDGFAFLEKLLK